MIAAFQEKNTCNQTDLTYKRCNIKQFRLSGVCKLKQFSVWTVLVYRFHYSALENTRVNRQQNQNDALKSVSLCVHMNICTGHIHLWKCLWTGESICVSCIFHVKAPCNKQRNKGARVTWWIERGCFSKVKRWKSDVC